MSKLIPESEVRNRLAGISHTTFWRMRRAGEFPAPISISANRKGWREGDVDAWLKSRAEAAA